MATHTIVEGVVVDEATLGIDEMARICCVETTWVIERVEAGLLGDLAEAGPHGWRFASAQVIRARRLASLERDMDANPELAALVADLIEEVQRLRRRLGEP